MSKSAAGFLIFVLDASVALAWCFKDESSRYANSVLLALRTTVALAPVIWLLELANALVAAKRRKGISQADIAVLFDAFAVLPIHLEPATGCERLPQLSSIPVQPTTKSQLIPPPELAPPSVSHLSLEQRVALWAELVDESEALLLAGLRAKIGPNGDIETAYRAWYARRMDEHDRRQIQLAENLTRLEQDHGK